MYSLFVVVKSILLFNTCNSDLDLANVIVGSFMYGKIINCTEDTEKYKLKKLRPAYLLH